MEEADRQPLRLPVPKVVTATCFVQESEATQMDSLSDGNDNVVAFASLLKVQAFRASRDLERLELGPMFIWIEFKET